MTKRTAEAQRTQAENEAGPELAHLVEPMLAGMTITRHHLLAWVHAHGLAALDELFREEAVALAGPKGRHQPQRTHHHWGTAATELTFGGRRVQVRRPRVRRRAGGEATLPSVATFRTRDPLTARMMQQLLAGVSMRHYEGSLEARPSGRPTRGSSKSAVSRTVVRRTRQRLQEYLARRLDGLAVHGRRRGGAADGDRRPGDHARRRQGPAGLAAGLDGERRGLHRAAAGPARPRAHARRAWAVGDRRRQGAAQGAGRCLRRRRGHSTLPAPQGA